MSLAHTMLHYLQQNRDQMVDFLSRLVLAESPSTRMETQAKPLAILGEALQELGFTVQIIPGRLTGGHLVAAYNVDADTAGTRPFQLLIGHCDTVWPVGTLESMPLVVEDNIVRGPGVYDMKSGLTQMIFALRALQAAGSTLPHPPVILINSDEEIGSHESLSEIHRFSQGAVRAFVLEPSLGEAGKLKTARKGVGTFEVVVHGRAAHAGLDPEKGVSAVLALSYIIQDLHALNDREKGISVNVGRVAGGLRTNVVPAEARAEVDARAQTLQDAQMLEETILSLSTPIPGSRLEVSGRFNRPPLERTPRNQALWRTAQAAGQELGLNLQQGSAGGGSDGNFASLYTATLDGLGAVGDGAHAQHEFIFIDRMIERTALLALLLLAP